MIYECLDCGYNADGCDCNEFNDGSKGGRMKVKSAGDEKFISFRIVRDDDGSVNAEYSQVCCVNKTLAEAQKQGAQVLSSAPRRYERVCEIVILEHLDDGTYKLAGQAVAPVPSVVWR